MTIEAGGNADLIPSGGTVPMDPARLAFARQAFGWCMEAMDVYGVAPLFAPEYALIGAAQACVETGWGTSKGLLRHNNAFGIKPSDPLHKRVGPIRVYAEPSESAISWAYLILRSRHYDRARALLQAYLNSPETGGAANAFEAFAHDFCAVYEPLNPGYGALVVWIMQRLRPYLIG